MQRCLHLPTGASARPAANTTRPVYAGAASTSQSVLVSRTGVSSASGRSQWAAPHQTPRQRSSVAACACSYQVLGLRPLQATEEDIKQAYRAKARETHPDCTGDAQSALQFLEVQKAYTLLMDPAKRSKYDARLKPRSRTVLSYLNARAAVRSGFQQGSPGVVDEEMREELYSTMRDLLRQARRCMRQVEKELNKGEHLHIKRGTAAARGHSNASQSPEPQRAQPVPVHMLECIEGEPCEPWLYYAAAAARSSEAGRSKQ